MDERLEKWQKILKGSVYNRDIISDEQRMAMRSDGVIIAYGASDDLVEFDGAIHDEADGPGNVLFDHNGHILENDCDDEDCPFFAKEKLKAELNNRFIVSKWCEHVTASWSFLVPFEHVTFNVFEDDELFCIGVIFLQETLKGK